MAYIKRFNEEREYRATNEPNPNDEEQSILNYIKSNSDKSDYEIYHELRNLGFEGPEIAKYLDKEEL